MAGKPRILSGPSGLVPPGEALWAAVEETNMRNLFFFKFFGFNGVL